MKFLSEADRDPQGTGLDEASFPRRAVCDNRCDPRVAHDPREDDPDERQPMSKRARKRRSRKGNKANHGRKPNA